MAKGENCFFWAISSFAIMLWKVVYCRGIRKRLYVGKGKIWPRFKGLSQYFIFLPRCRLQQICNFPPTTNLKQTSLKLSRQKHRNHSKCRYNHWKKVENIMAIEETACFEQFLLLSVCFQKSSAAEASKSVYMREKESVPLKLIEVNFWQ